MSHRSHIPGAIDASYRFEWRVRL